MNLSNVLRLLGISVFLSLGTAAAEDEIATQTELEELNSNHLELQAQLDGQLAIQIDQWMEVELDPVLTGHMTRNLRRQNRPAYQRDDAPPPAMLAPTDDPPANAAQQSSNTTCKMIGRTLECVLRDPATR
jgi:hypothetical protein